VKALFGDETVRRSSGRVTFLGQEVHFHCPENALRCGLSFVSEDRKGESILPDRSLNENARISSLAVFFNRLRINDEQEAELSSKRLKELNTKCTGVTQEISQLSGGNQQKVILARAMETDASLIILDEPTRGIDVKAKSEIYEIIFKLAQSGKGVLLISSDLPELMALSDRIAMMREGKIQGTLERGSYSAVELMRMAFGT
jgi:ABC-type sugar transport system ATPase subunit